MFTRLTIAIAAILGMLLGSPVTRAADTWPVQTEWDRTDMFIQFGEYQNDLMVYPGKLTLQRGELYRFVVINPSEMTHIVAAPEFSEKTLTSALMKTPASADLAKASLAEGIVVRPGEMMEWYFMPVKEGTYKFGCAQSAHAKAGMHAMIEVL
ncbi:MAG: plastocyanin/azurin family copper-binding protein [Gammaproteobacteria bacterium]|nr:plastocyanin/azurin family copper-binding protein [Gammaproteobacteria bacterium]